MTLRNRFLDALIDGKVGDGIVITRNQFMVFFAQENPATTGCFLSNSEIETGVHSPSYAHFTLRVSEGTYRVHPSALQDRMEQRGMLPATDKHTHSGFKRTDISNATRVMHLGNS